MLFTTLRFDDGTTANDPACGAYEAVIVVLFDDAFVVIDDVFVEMDCKTAVELTAIEPPDVATRTQINSIQFNQTIDQQIKHHSNYLDCC